METITFVSVSRLGRCVQSVWDQWNLILRNYYLSYFSVRFVYRLYACVADRNTITEIEFGQRRRKTWQLCTIAGLKLIDQRRGELQENSRHVAVLIQSLLYQLFEVFLYILIENKQLNFFFFFMEITESWIKALDGEGPSSQFTCDMFYTKAFYQCCMICFSREWYSHRFYL